MNPLKHNNNKKVGNNGESAACDYLQNCGLQLVERNYYRRCGEIDLIMKDKNMFVFVEVKTRNSFEEALQSVTKSKQYRLRRTATAYLQENKLTNKVICRFDVVSVNSALEFYWVKNAFC